MAALAQHRNDIAEEDEEYPVEKLRNIKQVHEATHKASRFQIKEAELLKRVKEMEKFWERIERLNRVEHSMRIRSRTETGNFTISVLRIGSRGCGLT